MGATDPVALVKKVRVKAKLCFDSEKIAANQKGDKLDSRYKNPILKTVKNKFQISKTIFQKMLHRKKAPCLRKN